MAPEYLTDIITLSEPKYNMCSSEKIQLDIPTTISGPTAIIPLSNNTHGKLNMDHSILWLRKTMDVIEHWP